MITVSCQIQFENAAKIRF